MATPPVSARPDLGSLRIHDGQRSQSKMGKRVLIAAIPVFIFAIIVAAAFAFRNQKPVVEVVAAAKPDAGGRQALLNASGYVTPRRRATIAAKITGRVTAVFFDEGTPVSEGQLLATLDDSDAKRSLDSAKADRDASRAAIADYEVQLKNAQILLHRAEQLQKAGVQTQEALDNATTAVDSLKAKIELAKQQVAASESRIGVAQQAVDNCIIRAPFGGIVVSKDAQVGEMVSPNSAGGGFTRTGIATIVDMKSNEIEVDVNESYIARVVPDQQVTATLDAYPDWQIPSKVRTVIPTADRQKATVKVRISFLKLDPRILPDMGVKVAFLDDEKPVAKEKGQGKGPQAVAFIPKSAVRSEAGTSFVLLVRDGKLERRAISLGLDRGTEVAVLAGIAPGDSLVVKGPQGLHEGDKVEIR
ncbi:MAG TPA: efflux RND transporter periplasmic adaptor subunit [Candidatus Udaeobacter sp.]|jgi:RND family efflux transporter MFP subunit|nr:efflux RND transporter periplasmic adaptor subunit [Candidatus Udaeobacter sp.]